MTWAVTGRPRRSTKGGCAVQNLVGLEIQFDDVVMTIIDVQRVGGDTMLTARRKDSGPEDLKAVFRLGDVAEKLRCSQS